MLIEVKKLDERVGKAISVAEKLAEDNRRLKESIRQLQTGVRNRKKFGKEGTSGGNSQLQKMTKAVNLLIVERKSLVRKLEEILKKLETIV